MLASACPVRVAHRVSVESLALRVPLAMSERLARKARMASMAHKASTALMASMAKTVFQAVVDHQAKRVSWATLVMRSRVSSRFISTH